MKRLAVVLLLLSFCLIPSKTPAADPPLSEATRACIECHESVFPGILADWRKGRMARTTPAEAAKKPALSRRVSYETIPDRLANVAVGCAECHTLNPEKHPDSFEHNGYSVHVVVTPEDCATCHPVERKEYDQNLMSHAHGNLQNNPVFMSLADATNGLLSFKGNGGLTHQRPDALTEADSCLSCHGTMVQRTGTITRETDFGEMELPVLSGWPNQGVGRINPDGSKGCCTACHTRHQFDIGMARKPYTCSQCHKGPDVPAYKVYSVSKHGNIYKAKGQEPSWDFKAVPWTVGKDFTAPTCAGCHVSLLVSEQGDVLARRTHQMNDRLPNRLFGLIYAHPHPISPDTTIIRNQAGLPLPTELTGEPAMAFLIGPEEQVRRRAAMQDVCLSCHGRQWVEGHFERLDRSIETTNAMTLTATQILLEAYEKGAARGLAQNDSLFNEAIETKWVEQWLFYANAVRLASAMGGADYGVFAGGRWYLSKNIHEMRDWLQFSQPKEE